MREVTVALWLDLRNKKNYVRLNIKELKDKQKVTAGGELFIPIGADSDLWALLEQQKYSGDAALYFTVCDIVTDCQNKLDIVYNEVGQRNKHIFRAETKNTYTYIPSQTKATGYFADAEGNVLKRVIDYNTTAYMIVNLINGRKNGLDKYQFTYLINENRPGEDRSVERNRFKPDANGCLKKELPLLGLYGESTHKRDMKHDFRPRLFYFIIYREDKDAKWFPNKTDLCIYPTDYKKDGDNDVYLHIDIQKHTTAEDIKKDKEFKEEQELNIGNIYDTTPRFGVKVYTAPKKSVSFSVVPVKDKTSQELADERNKQIDKKNKDAFPNIESTLGRNYSLQLKVAKDTGLNQSLEKISPVIIGEGNRRKAKGKCECKQYNLIWGKSVSCAFRKKVVKICAELWTEDRKIEMANGLMAVMAVETGRTFKAHRIMGIKLKANASDVVASDFDQWTNKTGKDGNIVTDSNGKPVKVRSSRAVGLLQFTQAVFEDIGLFKKGSGFDALHRAKLKFAQKGEIAQLDDVKNYLAKGKNKILKPEDIYIYVFAPDRINMRNPDDVLYDSKTDGEKYRQNESVDTDGNKDGKIQRKELLDRYYKLYKEGKGINLFTGKCECFEEESKSTDGWHDPVDNPQICLYSQGGASKKPWHGSYGRKIRDGSRNHAGIDLFALPGTPVYACVDAVVVTCATSGSMAGNMVALLVLDNKYFKDNYQANFKPKYKDKGELVEQNFSVDKSIYLVYFHLTKWIVKKDERVISGQIIGYSGVTEGGGKTFKTANPHLHFEINNIGAKGGIDKKCNPLMYVKAKYEEDLSQKDIELQENTKKEYLKKK